MSASCRCDSSRGAERRWTALDRLRGLVVASESFQAGIGEAVRETWREGVSVFELAAILGVDRSTVYRRYLSPTVEPAGAVKGGREDDGVDP
jgi:hypothetical protein